MTGRQTGVVARWVRHDYGFIQGADGREVFLHVCATGWQQLPPGTRVAFTVDSDSSGRLRAAHVRVLDDADE
jgi:cold shock CspA family protein